MMGSFLMLFLKLAAPYLVLAILITIIQFIFLYILLKNIYKVEYFSLWTVGGIVFFAGVFASGFGAWSLPAYILLVSYALTKYNLSKTKSFAGAVFLAILTIGTHFLGIYFIGLNAERTIPASYQENNQMVEKTWVPFVSIKDRFKTKFIGKPETKEVSNRYYSMVYNSRSYTYHDKINGLDAVYDVTVIDDVGQFDSDSAGGTEGEWQALEKALGRQVIDLEIGKKNGLKYERTKLNDSSAIKFTDSVRQFAKGYILKSTISNKFYLLQTRFFVDQSDHEKFINSFELITGDLSQLDSDNDGLNDVIETNLLKTDPFNPDTDQDGYSDGEEVSKGFDPKGSGKLKNNF